MKTKSKGIMKAISLAILTFIFIGIVTSIACMLSGCSTYDPEPIPVPEDSYTKVIIGTWEVFDAQKTYYSPVRQIEKVEIQEAYRDVRFEFTPKGVLYAYAKNKKGDYKEADFISATYEIMKDEYSSYLVVKWMSSKKLVTKGESGRNVYHLNISGNVMHWHQKLYDDHKGFYHMVFVLKRFN